MPDIDSPEEMIEAWDWETASPTGKPVSRKESYEKGIPHEGVHLWIVRTVPEWQILFQHRAKSKKLYPDTLDITVGGHVPYGMHIDKIQKEAQEEIGLNPDPRDLIDLGYYRYEEHVKNIHHREFQHVHLLHRNDPLSSYNFKDGEVEGIYAVPFSSFKQMLGEDVSMTVEGFNGTGTQFVTISKKDFHPLLFAPSMEQYLNALVMIIQEFFETGTTTTRMKVGGLY